jgi:proteasome assembly chaperone (PAC2) family protein
VSLVRGKLFACLALGLLQMNNVILLGLLGRVGVLIADYLLQHLHLLTVLVHYVRFLLHEVRLRLLTNNNRLLELLRLLSAVA